MIRRYASRHGFSLIEMAFVVGLIGALIGGIWTIGASAFASMRMRETVRQVETVARNVQNYYRGRPLPAGAASNVEFTRLMKKAGAFPGDMCDAACMADADGVVRYADKGSLSVSIPDVTPVPINFFNIDMKNIPQATCMQLGIELKKNADETGLVSYENESIVRDYFGTLLSEMILRCSEMSEATITYKIRH